MEILNFGTIYLNGMPLGPGFAYDASTPILLGDTVAGKELSWVRVGQNYVGRQCICVKISWEQLDQGGFINSLARRPRPSGRG